MSLLGIDIGTTGCKAEAFSLEGKPLAFAYREYPNIERQSGCFEQNPDLVWHHVCDAIKEINRKLKRYPVRMLSISVSGDEIIPVAEDGSCLHHVITSSDKRGEESCRRITAHFGIKRIYHKTGIVPMRKYGICRALWYQMSEPEVFKKTWRFLTWEDFIYFRMGLTDPPCSYSSLARLMILDIRTKALWKEMLAFTKIDASKFSRGVNSGEMIGTVDTVISKELGFNEPPVIAAGGFDQACAAFGAGVVDAKHAMVGTGTMESLCVCADKPIESKRLMRGHYTGSLHVVNGMYNCTATNVCGGAMLKWLRDTLFEEEKKAAEKSGADIYTQMLSGLSRSPSGLIVLPHFAGSGPPYKDADAAGVILGMTLDTSRKTIVLGVLEGITFELRQNIENMEQGTGKGIETLYAVGGGAKSDFWLQLKADITGKKVVRMDVHDAGCTACAMLGWMALNDTQDDRKAADVFVHQNAVFEPDMKRHGDYSRIYEIYKKVYPDTKTISHQLKGRV